MPTPEPDLYYETSDQLSSRCRADSAPINLDQWLTDGVIIDADGIHYEQASGQPIRNPHGYFPERDSTGWIYR